MLYPASAEAPAIDVRKLVCTVDDVWHDNGPRLAQPLRRRLDVAGARHRDIRMARPQLLARHRRQRHRPRADRRRRRRRGDDAAGGDLPPRFGRAVRERGGDELGRQRRHRERDEAIAEVAVVAHAAGGRANDARVVDVDRIGDDRRCGIGRGRGRREDGDAVGDAKREAAAAPARRRDAAHR